MKHFIWGEWRSDEELQEIAREMNQLGRNIERKLDNVSRWAKEAIEANKRRDGKAF